ncbi:unnamed protein product [Choristocarpus tenellus]
MRAKAGLRRSRPTCCAVMLGLGTTNGDKEESPSTPFRVLPNFVPEEKRRPKTFVLRDITEYPNAALIEDAFEVYAMAWEEFMDWFRRTVDRNVQGIPFEFDRRQWMSSVRKWCSRAVEADENAKAEFFRMYGQGLQERDAWGRENVSVDTRVEDEWDNIYMECSDCDTYDGQEIIDCAIRGSWSCTYEEDEAALVDFSPR